MIIGLGGGLRVRVGAAAGLNFLVGVYGLISRLEKMRTSVRLRVGVHQKLKELQFERQRGKRGHKTYTQGHSKGFRQVKGQGGT